MEGAFTYFFFPCSVCFQMETSVSGEKLFRVGEDGRDIFATVSNYQDKPSIHIRYFATEKRFPSFKGISLRPSEFETLLEQSAELRKELRKINKAKRLKTTPDSKRKQKPSASCED